VDVQITLAGRGDRSARIYRQLRDAILDGRLRRGDRLPATRDLAGQLGVSRNTVAAAYDSLTAEGFVAARVGDGTYVEAVARRLRADRRRAPSGRQVGPSPRWQQLVADAGPPLAVPRATSPYDFGVGMPDPTLFPWQAWRRVVSAELRPRPGRDRGYADPRGDASFRDAIARYLGVSRSVKASADDVLVTQGAQQALDLVARVMLTPGSVVAMELPGYPPARQLFASYGAEVVGVPVDDEGLLVDALPRRATVVYTTPSHQFPLGVAMSLRRRTALLAWARRSGAVVVEDDYDSEFRFSDRPLEPLQSLDDSGHVVYVGTFSKTMLPTLRLGFCVAPASLHGAIVAAKQLSDWHGEAATERAMAHLIDEGLLARHVRKASKVYAARHAALVEACDEEIGDLLMRLPSAAGLHLALRCPDSTPADFPARVVAGAERQGVVVEDLGRYGADDATGLRGFALGFGLVHADDVRPGIQTFAKVLRSTLR
jgi:GntR family transcriptional regulator/MocR family aminotransferase